MVLEQKIFQARGFEKFRLISLKSCTRAHWNSSKNPHKIVTKSIPINFELEDLCFPEHFKWENLETFKAALNYSNCLRRCIYSTLNLLVKK